MLVDVFLTELSYVLLPVIFSFMLSWQTDQPVGGGDLLASPQERYYNSFHLLTNQNKPGMVHIFEYT